MADRRAPYSLAPNPTERTTVAIFRAREAFAFTDQQGIPRVVRPGDLFDSGDACLKGRGHLFEPVEVNAERRRATVEDASAAPGEKRSVSAPAKKAPAKKAAPTQPQTTEDDGGTSAV